MSESKKSPRQILESPFNKEQIKSRPGNFGQTLAYVEGHAVIRRLNEAFDGAWSFEVVEHTILDAEVLVLGKLTCPDGVKMAFGGAGITHIKESGEVVSIVDDLKAAATDALKKAATLMGVGLHLYEDTQPAEAPAKPKTEAKPGDNGKGNGTGNRTEEPKEKSNGNGSPRITAKQLAYLYSLIRDRQMTKDDLQRLAVQRYQKMPDFISKQQASDLIQQLQSA